ncbi:hypothetical protein Csa_017818 [Cucumis sativus]|nr:hypothetical protein Csa_017818 [Cucumis sativus]
MQPKYTKNLQHRHRCVGRLILLTLVLSLNKQFTSNCPHNGGSSLANFAFRPKCRKKAKAEGGLLLRLRKNCPIGYISWCRERKGSRKPQSQYERGKKLEKAYWLHLALGWGPPDLLRHRLNTETHGNIRSRMDIQDKDEGSPSRKMITSLRSELPLYPFRYQEAKGRESELENINQGGR